VDIGTIVMTSTPSVSFVLEGAESCGLLLTGPAGRTGLAVVYARRTGPAMFQADVPEPGQWFVVAVCGGRERPVSPPVIGVAPASQVQTVRLFWPQ
jgi:hypothetical protein